MQVVYSKEEFAYHPKEVNTVLMRSRMTPNNSLLCNYESISRICLVPLYNYVQC